MGGTLFTLLFLYGPITNVFFNFIISHIVVNVCHNYKSDYIAKHVDAAQFSNFQKNACFIFI